jgi:DNA modification methylase
LKIFVSKVEEIKQAKELKFEPTFGFGKYRPLFPQKAVEHPAKMNVNLLEFLIEKYTKEGDVILDPMAGTGSTGVLASLHNRNAILVELEKKFVDWIDQAKEKVETMATLTPKGEIRVIQGDSRKLSELLKDGQTDTIITSPPYAEAQFDYKHGMNKYVSPNWKGRKAFEERRKMEYSENNITLLKHGNVDTIITSPPYGEQQSPRRGGGNIGFVRPSKDGKIGTDLRDKSWFISDNPDNIANLRHGDIDTIITSPPFSEANRGGGIAREGYEGRYGKDDKLHLRHDRPLSDNPDNIGNMKQETYLQAMLQVYKEMYNVLKEGGRAIIAVRPFAQNKKVVDLPYHTWLLLEKVGFQLEDVWKLHLKNLSFWRILQYKKNPEQEQIRHEYILVVKK